MPTGWRPADVAKKYPVPKIDNVYNFEKYKTPASKTFIAWAWHHYIVTLFLTLYLFYQLGKMDYVIILLYSSILFLSVYGYTSLMDREKSAVWVELAKSLIGIGAMISMGNWFGIEGMIPNILIVLYFVAAPLGAYYFMSKNEEEFEISSQIS